MINQSIPVPEDPTSIHQYDRCHVIQYKSNTSSLIKCTEWVYDSSVFDETFASKVRISVCIIRFSDKHIIIIIIIQNNILKINLLLPKVQILHA